MCGAFSGFCSLPSPPFAFCCVMGACLIKGVGAHGWVVRFWQPSVWFPSWSWLPIVVAPGCLGHPTSTDSVSATKLFKHYQTPLSYPVNNNNLSNGWFCYLTIGLEACSLQ